MNLAQDLQIAAWLCGIVLVGCGVGWIILKTLNASRGDGE